MLVKVSYIVDVFRVKFAVRPIGASYRKKRQPFAAHCQVPLRVYDTFFTCLLLKSLFRGQ